MVLMEAHCYGVTRPVCWDHYVVVSYKGSDGDGGKVTMVTIVIIVTMEMSWILAESFGETGQEVQVHRAHDTHIMLCTLLK